LADDNTKADESITATDHILTTHSDILTKVD